MLTRLPPPRRSYVVDAAAGERLEESRAALEQARPQRASVLPVSAHAARTQALASRELEGAPLLLLANKSDIAGACLPRAQTPRSNAHAHSSPLQATTGARRSRRRSPGSQRSAGSAPCASSRRVPPAQVACASVALMPLLTKQCCALSGDGLRAGLAWALDAARHSRRSRLLDAAAANA